MTRFSLQPIESVEMTHLARTFFDKGEMHTTLSTYDTTYINCSPGRYVISTLSETYDPQGVIYASLLRHTPGRAGRSEGRQSGMVGKAAVPPGGICMWGGSAHNPASVRRLN